MVYHEGTTQFSLTQSPSSNTTLGTYVTIAHEILPLIQRGILPDTNKICARYAQMDGLIRAFAFKTEPYRWNFNGPQTSLTELIDIFDRLESDILTICPKIYQLNTEAQKAIDDNTAINFLLTKTFSDRFEEAIATTKIEDQNKVIDITEEKMFRLITSLIDLYNDAIKKLQKNLTTFTTTDEKHTRFIKMFTNHVEAYNSARTQIAVLKSSTSEITKKAAAENLYVLLSIHLQHLKREWRESTEEFYIQPIIDFLASSISAETKIFADIIVAKYEGAEAKYDIEFNDELHERWSLQQARFMSIENGHLLKSAEDIARAYEHFRALFRTLLSDHQSPLALFETLKPLLTQYKKEVTKKVNVLENLINKEIPSSAHKKKRKKKAANKTDSSSAELTLFVDTNNEGTQGKVVETSDLAEKSKYQAIPQNEEEVDATIVAEGVVSTQQQSLTSEQRKKIRKGANRLKRAERDDAPKQIREEAETEELAETEALAVIPAEQNRSTKEKKQKRLANIAHQQQIEKQRKETELAALAEKKRLVKLAKQEEREQKTNLTAQSHFLKESAKPAADLDTTALEQKVKGFTLNPRAAEFKLTVPTTEKQQEEGSEQDTTVGYYSGSNPTTSQLVYHSHQAYDPDYAAWLAQQRAWQQYYASLGYQIIPYGYPTQQPHLLSDQVQQPHS